MRNMDNIIIASSFQYIKSKTIFIMCASCSTQKAALYMCLTMQYSEFPFTSCISMGLLLESSSVLVSNKAIPNEFCFTDPAWSLFTHTPHVHIRTCKMSDKNFVWTLCLIGTGYTNISSLNCFYLYRPNFCEWPV